MERSESTRGNVILDRPTFFLKMPKAKASHYNGPDILKGGVHSSLRNMSNVKKTSDGEESFN